MIKEANEILQKTPEMLPVLKEAGVVDSGGQGLCGIPEGCCLMLSLVKKLIVSSVEKTAVKPAATASEAPLEEKDIKFGYCTEFIVMTQEEISMEEEQKFKDFLMGTSEILSWLLQMKISLKYMCIQTILEWRSTKGLTYGRTLPNMKIDNMREEHQRTFKSHTGRSTGRRKQTRRDREKRLLDLWQYRLVQGMDDIFRELGVDYLIEGGQTMNPSTEDMLNAIEQVQCRD